MRELGASAGLGRERLSLRYFSLRPLSHKFEVYDFDEVAHLQAVAEQELVWVHGVQQFVVEVLVVAAHREVEEAVDLQLIAALEDESTYRDIGG